MAAVALSPASLRNPSSVGAGPFSSSSSPSHPNHQQQQSPVMSATPTLLQHQSKHQSLASSEGAATTTSLSGGHHTASTRSDKGNSSRHHQQQQENFFSAIGGASTTSLTTLSPTTGNAGVNAGNHYYNNHGTGATNSPQQHQSPSTSIDDLVDGELKKWFRDFIDEVKKLRRQKKKQQQQQQSLGVGGSGGPLMNASVTSSAQNSHLGGPSHLAPYCDNGTEILVNGGMAHQPHSASSTPSTMSGSTVRSNPTTTTTHTSASAAGGAAAVRPISGFSDLSNRIGGVGGGKNGMLGVVDDHEDLLEATTARTAAAAGGVIHDIRNVTSTETTPSSTPAANGRHGLSGNSRQNAATHHQSHQSSGGAAGAGGSSSATSDNLPPPTICIDADGDASVDGAMPLVMPRLDSGGDLIQLIPTAESAGNAKGRAAVGEVAINNTNHHVSKQHVGGGGGLTPLPSARAGGGGGADIMVTTNSLFDATTASQFAFTSNMMSPLPSYFEGNGGGGSAVTTTLSYNNNHNNVSTATFAGTVVGDRTLHSAVNPSIKVGGAGAGHLTTGGGAANGGGGLSAANPNLAPPPGSARRTVSFLEGSRTEYPGVTPRGAGTGSSGSGGNGTATPSSGRESVGLESKLGSAIREMSRKEIENSLEQAVRLIFELIKANSKATGGGSSALANAVGIGGGMHGTDASSRRTSLSRKESTARMRPSSLMSASAASAIAHHHHRGSLSRNATLTNSISNNNNNNNTNNNNNNTNPLYNNSTAMSLAGASSVSSSVAGGGGGASRASPRGHSSHSSSINNGGGGGGGGPNASATAFPTATNGVNAALVTSFEHSTNGGMPSIPSPTSANSPATPATAGGGGGGSNAAEIDWHAFVDDDFADFEDQRANARKERAAQAQAAQAARLAAMRLMQQQEEEDNDDDDDGTDSSASSADLRQQQLINHAKATARLVVTDSMDVDDLMGSASLDEDAIAQFVEHNNLKREKDRETGNIIINDFVVLGNLGQGAYGKVKLAHARNDKSKLVAIKIINKSLTKKQGALRQGATSESQIRREIAIMKKLRHKNIVSLHSVVDDPEAEKMYMVMDYIGGGTILKDEMDPKRKAEGFLYTPVAEELAVSYLRQLIDGLRHMHKHGIAHRDIKPANILLNNSRVYLSDFGVSELCDPEDSADGGLSSNNNPAIQPTRGPSFVAYSAMAPSPFSSRSPTTEIDASSTTPTRSTNGEKNVSFAAAPPRADEDTNPFAAFAATPIGFRGGGGADGSNSSAPTPTSPMRVKGHKGTPLFWPPEMFSSDPESEGFHNGEMQDLWALGVTLFMMLTGKAPFKANAFNELKKEVTSQRPVDIPDSLSHKARFLLHAMLNKDVNERLGLQDIRHHPFMGGYDKRSAADRGSIFVYATDLDEEDAITVTSGAVLPTHYLIAKVKPMLMRKIYRIREKQRLRKEAAAKAAANGGGSSSLGIPNNNSFNGTNAMNSPNSNASNLTINNSHNGIGSNNDSNLNSARLGTGGGGSSNNGSGPPIHNSTHTMQPFPSSSNTSSTHNLTTAPPSQHDTPTEPRIITPRGGGGAEASATASNKHSANTKQGGDGNSNTLLPFCEVLLQTPANAPTANNSVSSHRSATLELPNLNTIDVFVTQEVGGGGGMGSAVGAGAGGATAVGAATTPKRSNRSDSSVPIGGVGVGALSGSHESSGSGCFTPTPPNKIQSPTAMIGNNPRRTSLSTTVTSLNSTATTPTAGAQNNINTIAAVAGGSHAQNNNNGNSNANNDATLTNISLNLNGTLNNSAHSAAAGAAAAAGGAGVSPSGAHMAGTLRPRKSSVEQHAPSVVIPSATLSLGTTTAPQHRMGGGGMGGATPRGGVAADGGGGVYEQQQQQSRLTAANPYAGGSRIGFWRTGSSLANVMAASNSNNSNAANTHQSNSNPYTGVSVGVSNGGMAGANHSTTSSSPPSSVVVEQRPSTPQRGLALAGGSGDGSGAALGLSSSGGRPSPQALRPPTPTRRGLIGGGGAHQAASPTGASSGVGGGLGTRLPTATLSEQQQHSPILLNPPSLMNAGSSHGNGNSPSSALGSSNLFVSRAPLMGGGGAAGPRLGGGNTNNYLGAPSSLAGGAYGSFSVGPRVGGLAAGNRLYNSHDGLGGGGGLHGHHNNNLPNVHMTHNFTTSSSTSLSPLGPLRAGGGGGASSSLGSSTPLGYLHNHHTNNVAAANNNRAQSTLPGIRSSSLTGSGSNATAGRVDGAAAAGHGHGHGGGENNSSGNDANHPHLGASPSPSTSGHNNSTAAAAANKRSPSPSLGSSLQQHGAPHGGASSSSGSPSSRVRNRLSNALFSNATEEDF